MGTSGCSQTCTNSEGSFQCGCNAGYVLDSNRFSCNGESPVGSDWALANMIGSADINECLAGDNGGCDHVCLNFEASFNCSCREEFRLSSDGVSCTGKPLPCMKS